MKRFPVCAVKLLRNQLIIGANADGRWFPIGRTVDSMQLIRAKSKLSKTFTIAKLIKIVGKGYKADERKMNYSQKSVALAIKASC